MFVSLTTTYHAAMIRTPFDPLPLLSRDPQRHITPLKMYGLYREAMRVLPIFADTRNELPAAALLIAPRSASQYDQSHYADVQWVVYPALPANAGPGLMDAMADAVVTAVGDESFVLKTIDASLPPLVQQRRGTQAAPAPECRRALCTFGVDKHPGASADGTVLVSARIPDVARPLLRIHGVYSKAELDALFADGSARCHVRLADPSAGDGNAIGVLLTFPNTPAIHEIGSLHVRADARRAGHARALLASALADLRQRGLTVRYVVDAGNAPSIALATAVGLREQFRLAHWVFAAS